MWKIASPDAFSLYIFFYIFLNRSFNIIFYLILITNEKVKDIEAAVGRI